MSDAAADLRKSLRGQTFQTILADPPWQFQNRTGKMAPEHKRLTRYPTMTLPDICALPVEEVADAQAHLYLWVPNALLPEDGMPFAAFAPSQINSITVEITYDDLSTDSATYQRSDVMMP